MSQVPISPSPSLAERVQALKLPATVRAKPARRSVWPWLMLLLVALSAAAWWAKGGFKATAPAASASVSAPVVVPAERGLEAGGYIVPAQKVQISPKVGGQVVSLYRNLEEGLFVPKGTVLATLDATEYEFDLRRATALAELAQAKHEELAKGNREEEKKLAAAALRESQEQWEQTRDELGRLRDSGRAATPDELVRAESRFRALEQKVEQQKQTLKMMLDGPREERIRAAKAEWDQTIADRDKAQWRLDNTRVVSPINGVILEKKAEVGNMVRPEAFSNGLSASLCDMADLTNLEVDVDISERDIRQIKRGQKCKIWTEAVRDKSYEGVVARIMPVASRSKASVSVRVKIFMPENETELRPEMRARVKFLPDEEAKPAASSPASP